MIVTTSMDVQLYVTEDEKKPFVIWIKKLKDKDACGRINARIARLRLGNFGDCKALGNGLWELRIDVGPGYRVYYGRAGEQLVLLLCGGDKRTQDADIATAKKHWVDYKSRELNKE